MLKQFLKSCLRGILGLISGDTVRIIAGPLKGRRLLREHGLPNLSMVFGTYEPAFSNAFNTRINNASVVYDIGANTGYFSLLAANQVPRDGLIVAFEPIPSIISDLKKLMNTNGLNEKVQAWPLALSDGTGRIRMFTPGSATTNIMQTALRGRDLPETEGIEVDMETLDNFVLSSGNPAPEVIKIDVEGAESLVLSGARRVLKEIRPTILIEVHGAKPAADVWDIVVPLGYKVHLLTDGGETKITDRATWMQQFESSKWIIQHCVLTSDIPIAVAA